jgi:hypothetical protein
LEHYGRLHRPFTEVNKAFHLVYSIFPEFGVPLTAVGLIEIQHWQVNTSQQQH